MNFTTNNSPTTLCIIRHGETDWNASGRLQGRENTRLNGVGHLQALHVAGYLEKQQWDLIVSSPLKRAYETARIIATRLSLPDIIVMNSLIERDYGQASGLLPQERHARFADGIIPGQEDFEHLQNRAMDAMTEIVTKNKGKRIIVVSHGAFINSILYTLSDGAFGSFKTRLKNGCINRILFKDNTWSVEIYNKTPEEFTTIC